MPREPSDITILSTPSWWTPARLLVVVSSLSFILIFIMIWNRILQRLVERRSRQLFKTQIAHATDQLKVGERTRLAVELHDSLSQTLTGVAFQIDAAEQARRHNPSQVAQYLGTAKKALASCREELRNCLWDLRSNALEESDAVIAIRRAVEPHVGDAVLDIDFTLPRARMTDNTFHAVLSIFRELATNAVRHGAATRIAIVGHSEASGISLSVSDNGCGFDPDNRPGFDEGHFGLLSIAERVAALNGTLKIDSRPGHGTTISIILQP